MDEKRFGKEVATCFVADVAYSARHLVVESRGKERGSGWYEGSDIGSKELKEERSDSGRQKLP